MVVDVDEVVVVDVVAVVLTVRLVVVVVLEVSPVVDVDEFVAEVVVCGSLLITKKVLQPQHKHRVTLAVRINKAIRRNSTTPILF